MIKHLISIFGLLLSVLSFAQEGVSDLRYNASIYNASSYQSSLKKSASFDDIYSFDQFWNDYSKKVDLKKCKAHFKNLSNKEKQQIRDTVLNYVRINSDTKFRKNPLTYLNGKCWKDELIDYNISEPKKRKVNDGSDLYDIANG